MKKNLDVSNYIKYFSLLLIFIFKLLEPNAFSADVTGYTVFGYSNPTATSSYPLAQKAWGFPGMGVSWDFAVSQKVSIILGEYYLTRQIVTDSTVSMRYFDTQLGLKYKFGSFLSVDGGVYYNLPQYNPLVLTGSDMGGFLGLRFDMGKLRVGAQYHYALKSQIYNGSYFYTPDEVLVLIGIRLGKSSSSSASSYPRD